MSVESTDKTVEQFDEYEPFAGALGDEVSECVYCGRMEFVEYADEGGVCRRCRGDELQCLACRSTVRVVPSGSVVTPWGLECVRCGPVPSIDVKGDLEAAVEAAEEVNYGEH